MDIDAEEQEAEEMNNEEVLLPLKERIYEYVANSSLFIFNRHSKIRGYCLTLAETEAVLQELRQME